MNVPEPVVVPPSPADVQRAQIAQENGVGYDAKAQAVIEPAAPAATSEAPAAPTGQEPANSEAQTPTPVEGGGDEEVTPNAEGETTPAAHEGKNHVAKKIDKLTREKGDLQRQYEALQQQHLQLLQAQQQPQPPQAQQPQQVPGDQAVDPNDPQPDPAKYTDVSKFIADNAAWASRQEFKRMYAQAVRRHAEKTQQAQAAQHVQDVVENFTQRVEAGAKEIKDFAEVTKANADVEVSNHVAAQLATAVENPAVVLYHLAKNPAEVAKLNKMSAPQIAARLGAIEALATRPAPAISNAPAPGKPVGSKGSVTGLRDDMSMDEFVAMRNKKSA